MTVREARDAYLRENGFTVEAYDEPRTPVNFLGLEFSVPNTPTHRQAIMWHDLHHVVTGYGTNIVGEAEVSAWELRRGLEGLDLYVTSLVAGLALGGLFFAPRRTIRAWRASGGGRRNLFPSELDYERALNMTVAELRALLHVPEHGVADRPRRLHSGARTSSA